MLWPSLLWGQARIGTYERQAGNIVLPPPEAWRFAQYGNDRPDLYTGAMKTSVPVYFYKDKDFDLPITLDYASNGYKPNEQSGSVGMGWYLNAGGCINREVNGIPDETIVTEGPHHDYRKIYGFFRRTSSPPTFSELSNDLLAYGENNIMLFPYTVFKGNDEKIETFPDTFTFAFCGYYGKFCIVDGQARVFASNYPEGDFTISTHIRTDSDREDSVYLDGFTVNTGNGYTYVFGSDKNLQKHSRKNVALYVTDYGVKSSPKLNWPLTKIIAPGGRYVNFNYSEPVLCGIRRAAAVSYPRPWVLRSDSISGGYFIDLEGYNFVLDENPYYVSTIHSIDIDGKTRIDFLYTDSPKEKADTKGTDGIIELTTVPQLDRVVVKDASGPGSPVIKRTVRLSYKYGMQNPQRFLTGISEDGMGDYTMEYHNIDTEKLPYHGVTSIDIWGYNGFGWSYSLERPVGQTSNLNGTMLGMLETITYPTGGSTEIEYEKNDYAHAVAHNSGVGKGQTAKMFPFVVPCEKQQTGGVRVRKITDSDAAGRKYEREYVYESGGVSTGLQIYPQREMYNIVAGNAAPSIVVPPAEDVYNKFTCTSTLNNYFFDKTHIEYASVTEKHPDGSATVYHFSNMLDTPDIPVESNSTIHELNSLYNAEYYRASSSVSSQRGRLTGTDYLDASGKRLRSIINHYDKGDELGYIAAYTLSDKEIYVIKYFIDDYPLDRVTDRRYLGSDSVETVTRYTYNESGQLRSSTVTDAADKRYVTDYRYPSDTPKDPMCLQMSLYNARALPVRIRESLVRSCGDTLLLRGVKNEYGRSPRGNMRLLANKTTNLPEPVSRPGFDYDDLLENRTKYAYTAYGEVLSVTGRSDDTVYYIWGYGGMYPVAEIKGAALSDILSVEGLEKIETQPLPGGLNPNQAKILRSLPGAMTTVYDYTVPFGVSTVTDPSGRMTYYHYDGFGRLEMIQDDKGRPTEEYRFNIRH